MRRPRAKSQPLIRLARKAHFKPTGETRHLKVGESGSRGDDLPGRRHPGPERRGPTRRRVAAGAGGPGGRLVRFRDLVSGERTQSVWPLFPHGIGPGPGRGADPGRVRPGLAEARLVPGAKRLLLLALPAGRQRGTLGAPVAAAPDEPRDGDRRPRFLRATRAAEDPGSGRGPGARSLHPASRGPARSSFSTTWKATSTKRSRA